MKNFFLLDKLRPNGQIEWEEWKQAFDAQFTPLERQLGRDYKERLSGAKAYWSEAARSNPNSLNIDEFLAFTHPEFSQPLLLQEVELLMSTFDTNRDDLISPEEMINNNNNNAPSWIILQDSLREASSSLSSSSSSSASAATFSLFPRGGGANKEEYRLLDDNEDGLLSKRELLKVFDIRGDFWARKQARAIIEKSDINQDGYIQCSSSSNSSQESLELSNNQNSALNPDFFFHPLV